MCRYAVFATLPLLGEAEIAEIGRFRGFRHRRFPQGDHLFSQGFSPAFRMGRQACDCNTILGLGQGSPERTVTEPSSSRQKRWSRARIARWREEKGATAGRSASAKEGEAEAWTAFLRDVLTNGARRIALVVVEVSGRLEPFGADAVTEEIRLDLQGLTEQFYLEIQPGTRYLVSRG